MKFKELPAFTRCRDNGEHVPLHHLKRYVAMQIKEFGLILEPAFQRGHVWTDQQQIEFVEFQLRGGKTGKDLYFNDPRYNNWDNPYAEYVCVDGLQRLTALLKFLSNEIPVFGHYYSEFEDVPYDVSMYWHINDLATQKEVLQWYLEMNSGGTPHSKEELDRVKELLEALNKTE